MSPRDSQVRCFIWNFMPNGVEVLINSQEFTSHVMQLFKMEINKNLENKIKLEKRY